MSEPFWKTLVDRVRDEEGEKHLDPVRRQIDFRMPRPSVEREMLEEIAGALGRAVEKLELAIARAQELEASADQSPEALAAFEVARTDALRVRRDLQIHREALHLPRDPDFDARYPIPASKKSAR